MMREEIIELFKNPDHFGELDDATHSAHKHNSSCGDEFTVYLKLTPSNTVESASFSGSGCAISTAAASLLMDKLHGMNVLQIKDLTFESMQELLGMPISVGRAKCATLALDATKIALHIINSEE